MRSRIVAGNWKMHGSEHDIAELLANLKQDLSSDEQNQVVVFPPFVYLSQVHAAIDGSCLLLGAQNVSAHEVGAHTGEIAASMLNDFECTYVLVGHSERRQLYHEDNETVAKKFTQVQEKQMWPILCVGESAKERTDNLTESVISAQLDAVCKLGSERLERAVIAYEPIWAIGTGNTATPEQAQAVHAFIREKLSQVDADIAKKISILYGGSVKADNAKALFSMPDIDGGLVGGASLDAKQFIEIVQCIK